MMSSTFHHFESIGKLARNDFATFMLLNQRKRHYFTGEKLRKNRELYCSCSLNFPI